MPVVLSKTVVLAEMGKLGTKTALKSRPARLEITGLIVAVK